MIIGRRDGKDSDGGKPQKVSRFVAQCRILNNIAVFVEANKPLPTRKKICFSIPRDEVGRFLSWCAEIAFQCSAAFIVRGRLPTFPWPVYYGRPYATTPLRKLGIARFGRQPGMLDLRRRLVG